MRRLVGGDEIDSPALPWDVMEFIGSLLCDRRSLLTFALSCRVLKARYAAVVAPRSLATRWCSVCDDAPGLYEFRGCTSGLRCKNWSHWVRLSINVAELKQMKRLCGDCRRFTCDFCGQASCGCDIDPRSCRVCCKIAGALCCKENRKCREGVGAYSLCHSSGRLTFIFNF